MNYEEEFLLSDYCNINLVDKKAFPNTLRLIYDQWKFRKLQNTYSEYESPVKTEAKNQNSNSQISKYFIDVFLIVNNFIFQKETS